MVRSAATTLVCLMMLMTASYAQVTPKPVNVYVGVGWNIPIGYLKDPYDIGYHGTGKIGYRVSSKLELRGGIGYYGFMLDAVDVDGGNMSMLLFGGDLRLNLRAKPTDCGPIIHGGVGIANLNLSRLTRGDRMYWDDISESEIYGEVGLVLESSRGFFQIGYIVIATEGETTKFAPISVGIRL